jgi:hypothetical protein
MKLNACMVFVLRSGESGDVPQRTRAGSAGQRALGTVVFGGMLSSTLLAIPFVPVFYVVMERLSERLRKVKKN